MEGYGVDLQQPLASYLEQICDMGLWEKSSMGSSSMGATSRLMEHRLLASLTHPVLDRECKCVVFTANADG